MGHRGSKQQDNPQKEHEEHSHHHGTCECPLDHNSQPKSTTNGNSSAETNGGAVPSRDKRSSGEVSKENLTRSTEHHEHHKERRAVSEDGVANAQHQKKSANDLSAARERHETLLKEEKVMGEMSDLLQHQGKREDYHMGPVLGKGHFAVVRKCTSVKTNKEYAVKILGVDSLVNRESLVAELKILRQVKHHPNVVNLIDYFYTDHHFYLVMDLCLGGDLFSQITAHGKFTEHRAAVIAGQVADAVMHIHSCGVIHRDIKPENVLLVSSDPDCPVKVGDFGLSKIVNNDLSVMKTICGTWAYAAPEVILGKPYTSKVDNWSFGVLLYTLVSGYHPFDPYADLPQQEMLQRVTGCFFDFNDPIWARVSETGKRLFALGCCAGVCVGLMILFFFAAIALVAGLIKLDPEERMEFSDVFRSPWMRGQLVPSDSRPDVVFNMHKLRTKRLRLKVRFVKICLALSCFESHLI